MATIYISRDIHTLAAADAMAVRGAVSFSDPDAFEAEGECLACGSVRQMTFSAIDCETAVADCPSCGWGVRKYTGPDA
jgi:hypothetical protein